MKIWSFLLIFAFLTSSFGWKAGCMAAKWSLMRTLPCSALLCQHRICSMLGHTMLCYISLEYALTSSDHRIISQLVVKIINSVFIILAFWALFFCAFLNIDVFLQSALPQHRLTHLLLITPLTQTLNTPQHDGRQKTEIFLLGVLDWCCLYFPGGSTPWWCRWCC